MSRSPIVERFIALLEQAERTGDARKLAELFAHDAELLVLTRHNTRSKMPLPTPPKSSRAGAAHPPLLFWRHYLSALAEIRTEIVNVIDTGSTVVLEWHSRGSLPMGIPIEYRGVSIFDYEANGAADGNGAALIRRFRTYYDSAAFLPHANDSGKLFSESVGQPELTTQATS